MLKCSHLVTLVPICDDFYARVNPNFQNAKVVIDKFLLYDDERCDFCSTDNSSEDELPNTKRLIKQ